ncbi:MAG: hypothetical protein Harvfovirus73_1, partial [Harvfovirus sp.]
KRGECHRAKLYGELAIMVVSDKKSQDKILDLFNEMYEDVNFIAVIGR